MRTSVRIITVVVFAAFGLAAVAQHREDQDLPDDLYGLYQKKSEVIAEAIKNSKNEWAGTYLAGTHHPTVLRLEPNAGFIVSASHHTFAPSWINYGHVAISDSVLRIYPELEKDNSSAHIIGPEFRLIRWGRQHFLLTPDEFQPFAYAVHAGDEYQIAQYFTRTSDGDNSRRGLPNLPAEFATLMRTAPVRARVIAVGPDPGFAQTVTISAGSAQRIGKGMFFYYFSKDGFQYSIQITEVSTRSSSGEVRLMGGSSETPGGDEIRTGQKLTSRMPRGFIQPD